MNGIYDIESFDTNRSLGRLVNRLRNVMLERIGERLAPLDLTAAQWGVVVALADGLASTPVDLANVLDYDPGALTRLLDRLESKDILTRTPSTEDRRSVKIALTAHGNKLYPEILPLIVSVYNDLSKGLGSADAMQLQALLTRILANA